MKRPASRLAGRLVTADTRKPASPRTARLAGLRTFLKLQTPEKPQANVYRGLQACGLCGISPFRGNTRKPQAASPDIGARRRMIR